MRYSLLTSSICIILNSCVTPTAMIYYTEDGECYPTLASIQMTHDLEKRSGVDYVWFNCQWVTPTQRDSLSEIEFNRIWDEIVKQYDSIPD